MAKLTVNNYDYTITAEDTHEDLSIRNWIQMFTTAMIGISFLPETVYQGLKDYSEEFLNNE